MARAKRTDRADARRRHRQNQLAQAAMPDDLAVEGAAVSGGGATPVRSASSHPVAPGGRPGVFTAFRLAATQADVREDLRALPSLLRTRATLVPAALILGSLVAVFAAGAQRNLAVALAFQGFLVPPPMAASFLAGILTTRGAWLLGLLSGALAALGFAAVVLLAPDTVLAGLSQSATPMSQANREASALYGFAFSPLIGLLTGAFAGFYRRFLRLASPQQGRSASRGGTRPRKAAARR